MREWYYVHQGNRMGPVSEQTLSEHLRLGTVRPDDLVWTDGMADWARADSIPEFRASPPDGPPPIGPNDSMQGSLPEGDMFANEPIRPHRGGVILALGILGLLCCFLFGIAAWVMGNKELRAMRAGNVDPAGEGMTQAGRILGIIGTILGILSAAGWSIFWGLGGRGGHMRMHWGWPWWG